VGQASEFELSVRRKLGFVKSAEKSGGCGPVKTVIVIENSHPHAISSIRVGKLSSLPQLGGEKQVRRHG
jgi:hypothetical protein